LHLLSWRYRDPLKFVSELTIQSLRWPSDGRKTVEQTRTIEVGTLRRAGYVGKPANNWWIWRNQANAVGIEPSVWRNGNITLRRHNQILRTVGVPWRFGGERFYFLCDCGCKLPPAQQPCGSKALTGGARSQSQAAVAAIKEKGILSGRPVERSERNASRRV